MAANRVLTPNDIEDPTAPAVHDARSQAMGANQDDDATVVLQ